VLEGKEEGKDGKGGWGEDLEGGSARWHKNGGGSRPFFWVRFSCARGGSSSCGVLTRIGLVGRLKHDANIYLLLALILRMLLLEQYFFANWGEKTLSCGAMRL